MGDDRGMPKLGGVYDEASFFVPARQQERDERQKILREWAEKAFGAGQAASCAQRAVRLLEEAIELYQAAGCEPEMAHKLVDFVFSRPVGKVDQELGAVGVTALLFAEAAGLSADEVERTEMVRVLSKPIEVFTERNAAKNAAGFEAK